VIFVDGELYYILNDDVIHLIVAFHLFERIKSLT